MIEKEKFKVFNYIKKHEYIGSMDGMRYMLQKKDDGMEVVIWPEPNSYGKTAEELKIRKMFELSEAGAEEAADYLNSMFVELKDLWKK